MSLKHVEIHRNVKYIIHLLAILKKIGGKSDKCVLIFIFTLIIKTDYFKLAKLLSMMILTLMYIYTNRSIKGRFG